MRRHAYFRQVEHRLGMVAFFAGYVTSKKSMRSCPDGCESLVALTLEVAGRLSDVLIMSSSFLIVLLT